MSLIDEIRAAQRDAGEAAVIANLRRHGLIEQEKPDALHIAHCGNFLMNAAHQASATAGWWGKPDDTATQHDLVGLPEDVQLVRLGDTRFAKALVAQKLCLVHSEVSEAMEGHRKGLPDDKLPHRPMIEVELADAVIRICDLAGALGLDLGGAIAEKMAFNAQRPDHKAEARAAAGGKAY